jgi:hypothetical protein
MGSSVKRVEMRKRGSKMGSRWFSVFEIKNPIIPRFQWKKLFCHKLVKKDIFWKNIYKKVFVVKKFDPRALSLAQRESHWVSECSQRRARKNFFFPSRKDSGWKRFSTFGGYPSPFTHPAGVPTGGPRNSSPLAPPLWSLRVEGVRPSLPLRPPGLRTPRRPTDWGGGPSSPPEGEPPGVLPRMGTLYFPITRRLTHCEKCFH